MQSKSGFTIVELLIVIVIIGILSAVVFVAYTGIQDRARSAKMLSAMDMLEKGLRLYAEENGHYPEPTDVSNPSSTFICLQPTDGGWPAQDGLTSSQCFEGAGVPTAYSTVVKQALLSYISAIPDTSDVTLSGGGTMARGIMYLDAVDAGVDPAYPQGIAYLYYYVRGDQTCGRGMKSTGGVGDTSVTQCALILQ